MPIIVRTGALVVSMGINNCSLCVALGDAFARHQQHLGMMQDNNAVATTAKKNIMQNNAVKTYLILLKEEMTLFNSFRTLANCSISKIGRNNRMKLKGCS